MHPPSFLRMSACCPVVHSISSYFQKELNYIVCKFIDLLSNHFYGLTGQRVLLLSYIIYLHTFTICIASHLLLWGCENWANNKNNKLSLEQFHLNSIRHILSIKGKNTSIHKESQIIIIFANYLELSIYSCKHYHQQTTEIYISKIIRMNKNKIPPNILTELLTASTSDGGKHKTTCNAINENLCKIIPNLPSITNLSVWKNYAINNKS